MGFPTPVMSITRSVPARSLPRSRQWPTAPNQSKERSRGCDGRLRFRLQSRRRRAIVGHGVVSTGAPTPALIWVSPPGDYAIVNSNHIPDGTAPAVADDCATLASRRRATTLPGLVFHRQERVSFA